MKTTIDIPEDVLKEALRHTGAETKRDAIVEAVKDFNRRKRAESVVSIFGTFKNIMSQEELQAMRSERDKRHDKRWHGSR